MKVCNFIGFILVESGLCSAIKISYHQSMSYINGSLLIFRSPTSSNEHNLLSYPFEHSSILDIQAIQENSSYTIIQNDFVNLYDYRFLNPSRESPSRRSVYMLGSIKLKNLKNEKEDISKRFSSMQIDEGAATKEQWPSMSSPPTNMEFPDIEYESALLEFKDNAIEPLSQLYIMGGSKYISSKSSLEMIKHFSLFDSTTQAWEDLSGTLPEQLSQIAGHQLININNEKLVALGGYKTNNYTMETKIAPVDPIFNSLRSVFVYDIKQKKWGEKQTKMSEEDEKILSDRKQYSITAKYQYNKLYVYAGFESDLIKGTTSHYFGILDLEIWAWKWYQIGFNSDLKNMTSTSFDSILVNDAMIVSHSNCRISKNLKFFKFDLNLGYYSNLGNLSYNLSESHDDSTAPKTENFRIGLTVFLTMAAAVIITAILLFLYRYYYDSRQSKGYEIIFETRDVWSDPSAYIIKNNNIDNEHLRRYRLYQCFILQQLSSYTLLGQTFSYQEPEFSYIHESNSNSRTHVDMAQSLTKVPNTSESWDIYKTY